MVSSNVQLPEAPTATGGNGRHRKKRPEVAPVVEYDCEPRSESYRTPDPKQCDK